MSVRSPARRLLPAVAWALVGVLGAHSLTYDLLFPDRHVRHAVLAESGHGWLSLMPGVVAVALGVALVHGLLVATRQGGSRGTRFLALAALQVAMFMGMELTERLAVGFTVEALWHHLVEHDLGGILVVGVVLQLVTAWLGSTLSRAVARVGQRHHSPAWRRGRGMPHLLPWCSPVPGRDAVRAHRTRGPPCRRPLPASST